MTMNTLKEVYLAELQELHNVEEQLTQALPKMRDKAQHDELKQALASTWKRRVRSGNGSKAFCATTAPILRRTRIRRWNG